MNTVSELWTKMLGALEVEASTVAFDVFLKPLEPVEIVDNRLILLAPTESARNWVISRFHQLIKRVLSNENSLLTEVEVIEPGELGRYQARQFSPAPTEPAAPRPENVLLDPKYSFENFVVGKSNEFVYAAACAVAEEPGKRYNPLFIYGGVGLGKTHIMHAIGTSIRTTSNLKVLYVTSATFTNDFIEGIRGGSSQASAFRDKYRSVDVLMVDDVQFFSGKEGTQEEFFHTFNDLYQQGKQIVLTSDRPPKEISLLEDRLRSRFEGGLITDIMPPNLETRIAILQKKLMQKAEQGESIFINNEVLSFMADRVDRNVREMESLLNKVILLAKLSQKEPSIEIVKEALKGYQSRGEGQITVDEIIECTSRYFKISREEMLGKKKTKEIVEARQMCIYLITELLTLPLAAIGVIFGGRDHTTIMHSRNKVAEKVKSNIKLKITVQDIKDLLYK